MKKQPKQKAFLKSLSTILAICLLFGAVPFAVADDVPVKSISDELAPLDYSARRLKGEPLEEEATISVADSISLEADFAPNRIIVTVKHRNSQVNAETRTSWFSEMDVKEVRDLTAMETPRSSNSIFGMNIDTLHI